MNSIRWSAALDLDASTRSAYERLQLQPHAAKDIEDTVAAMLTHAACHLPEDWLRALRFGHDREKSERGRAIYRQLLRNAAAASAAWRPTCQDTGQAVVFVDVGQDARILGDLDAALQRGVARGYEKFRASVVRDVLFDRANTGNNTPAVVHTRVVPGQHVEVHVAEKGYGSENKSFMIMYPYPGAGEQAVEEVVCAQIAKAGADWCPPGVLSVAVGGNFEAAPLAAKRALLEPYDMDELLARAASRPESLTAKERLRVRLFEAVNRLGIGPQGLGGTTTVLDVKLTTLSTHIAGLPIAVNVQCNKAHHLGVTLDGSGPQTEFARADVAPYLAGLDDGAAAAPRRLQLPLDEATRLSLRAGERVLLSGRLLTGRDAAHKRMGETLDRNAPLPVELRGQLLYYVGPINPLGNEVVGPAGPTTASRMDPWTPRLLRETGLAGTIGKSERGPAVIEAIKETRTVYFIATGGAAYLQAQTIKSVRVLAYEDLGTEAIREMIVEDFPCVVAVDSRGENLHQSGRREFAVQK